MNKQNNTIFWIIGGILIAFLVGSQLGLFAIGGASMTRSVSSTASPGQKLSVTYTASASGTWGASIVDSVSGGCKFPDGSSQLKTVMLSADGNSKTIKVTAPSSGSCTFSGDYKFGTEAIKNFLGKTVTITIGNGNSNGNGDGINGDGNGNGINGNGVNGNGENGDGIINGNGEVPTFDLGMVLFKIGDLNVTLLMLLISIVALFVIKMMFSK